MEEKVFCEAYLSCMRACGLDAFATEALAVRFFALYSRLVAFDAHTNLTAVTEPHAVLYKHFADSLTVAALLPAGARVLDVGCGGGFPCLPLAVARPDLTIVALDSTAKKLVFVEETAKEMGLAVRTVCGRAEELAAVGAPMRASFDYVVARAVAALPILAELCMPFVKTGGTFLAMKGARGTEELAAATSAIAALGGAPATTHVVDLAPANLWWSEGETVPQERRIFAVKKEKATPQNLPRPYGKIKKKPL